MANGERQALHDVLRHLRVARSRAGPCRSVGVPTATIYRPSCLPALPGETRLCSVCSVAVKDAKHCTGVEAQEALLHDIGILSHAPRVSSLDEILWVGWSGSGVTTSQRAWFVFVCPPGSHPGCVKQAYLPFTPSICRVGSCVVCSWARSVKRLFLLLFFNARTSKDDSQCVDVRLLKLLAPARTMTQRNEHGQWNEYRNAESTRLL